MSHFVKEDKLSKLIHSNHFLLPVINRFGIRLGFKDKTVDEICIDKKINVDFFLAIVNTYTNKDYFPATDLMSFSPALIIEYLRKTHKYYFEYLFPEVERRLEKVLSGCQGHCDDLQLVKSFYQKYKEELSNHIQEEEQNVFPYVLAIVKAFENHEQLDEKYKNHSIYSFEQEHTHVDQKIYDLKNIVIKYLNPGYNDNDCNYFLFSIFQFERDLLDHARIEDVILTPKIMELEKVVKNG